MVPVSARVGGAVMVSESRRGCYGPSPMQRSRAGPYFGVTESRDSYVGEYWCLISIRLYSVSRAAILLHHAGICLTWKKS